jgi:hydrogenase nickel incorporation protein HypB
LTEGENNPLKYPTIFNGADVAAITKMDLANAMEFFDEAAACANIQLRGQACGCSPFRQRFRQKKSGAGMEEFFNFLLGQSVPCVRWLGDD